MSTAFYSSSRIAPFIFKGYRSEGWSRIGFLKFVLGVAFYACCTGAWAGIVPGISSAITSGTSTTQTSFNFTTSDLSGVKINAIKLYGGASTLTNNNVYLTGGNIGEGNNKNGVFTYNQTTDSGVFLTFSGGTLADFALAANQTYTLTIDTSTVAFTKGVLPVVDTELTPYFNSISNWTPNGIAFSVGIDSSTIASVPEASTMLLFALSAMSFGIFVYLKNRKSIPRAQTT